MKRKGSLQHKHTPAPAPDLQDTRPHSARAANRSSSYLRTKGEGLPVGQLQRSKAASSPFKSGDRKTSTSSFIASQERTASLRSTGGDSDRNSSDMDSWTSESPGLMTNESSPSASPRVNESIEVDRDLHGQLQEGDYEGFIRCLGYHVDVKELFILNRPLVVHALILMKNHPVGTDGYDIALKKLQYLLTKVDLTQNPKWVNQFSDKLNALPHRREVFEALCSHLSELKRVETKTLIQARDGDNRAFQQTMIRYLHQVADSSAIMPLFYEKEGQETKCGMKNIPKIVINEGVKKAHYQFVWQLCSMDLEGDITRNQSYQHIVYGMHGFLNLAHLFLIVRALYPYFSEAQRIKANIVIKDCYLVFREGNGDFTRKAQLQIGLLRKLNKKYLKRFYQKMDELWGEVLLHQQDPILSANTALFEQWSRSGAYVQQEYAFPVLLEQALIEQNPETYQQLVSDIAKEIKQLSASFYRQLKITDFFRAKWQSQDQGSAIDGMTQVSNHLYRYLTEFVLSCSKNELGKSVGLLIDLAQELHRNNLSGPEDLHFLMQVKCVLDQPAICRLPWLNDLSEERQKVWQDLCQLLAPNGSYNALKEHARNHPNSMPVVSILMGGVANVLENSINLMDCAEVLGIYYRHVVRLVKCHALMSGEFSSNICCFLRNFNPLQDKEVDALSAKQKPYAHYIDEDGRSCSPKINDQKLSALFRLRALVRRLYGLGGQSACESLHRSVQQWGSNRDLTTWNDSVLAAYQRLKGGSFQFNPLLFLPCETLSSPASGHRSSPDEISSMSSYK